MTHPLLAEIPFPAINPVAIHVGWLQIRWYGIAYLVGFLVAGMVFDKLVRDAFLPLTKEKVSDFIGWLVVSVILGGRLGYALFYEPALLTHPAELVKIWQGGLSFHGGLIGVAVGSWLFARREHVPWLRLGDAMALAIPFGIFLVRCANFINGELFGRIAPAWLPWAMRFPTDPAGRTLSPELARAGGLDWHQAYVQLKASGRWSQIAAHIPLRHPSQLYEALLEGVVTGVILWVIYLRRGKPARVTGGLAGAFLLLYAAARFLVEFAREPDPQLGTVLGPFTMGQILSVGVALGGLWLALRRPSAVDAAENPGL